MCGFAGFVGYMGLPQNTIFNVAQHMGEAIRHRGPDDHGTWLDESAQLALVHRRLSILDLSPAGHQPMVSNSGRWVIAFNGEIYNHLEIKKELEVARGPIAWRGHSDTETLLEAIDAWGLQKTLQLCEGMFAFGLWDRKKQHLTLARDRVGEKPLYYGWQKETFVFGSELKALKAHPSFSGEINRSAIALQMHHNYIPAPYTIYVDINKVPPGHFITLDIAKKSREVRSFQYWSLADVIRRGKQNQYDGSDDEAVEILDKLMSASVKKRMVADVPLGAFLSGGIDSSTIVSLMQAQSSRPVKTFTIGFEEKGYNEAVHAKAVARHLGTDHTELYITPDQAFQVIPKLPAIYDEPFSDPSQIPTFLVSEMTSQAVKVSLSGDAGDELFGGYNRYTMTSKIWAKLNKMPLSFRSVAADGLRTLSPSQWNNLAKFVPGIPRELNLGDRIHKGAGVLNSSSQAELYSRFLTHWDSASKLVLDSNELDTQITSPSIKLHNDIEQMMALDSLSYLPDDILCKVDRASMHVSLESRVPMLDSSIIEYAWTLPLSLKIRNGQGKWLLREVLYKYVPRDLVERPKMGFGVPLDSWLRGPLRGWAEELFDESRLRREGYFNPEPIRQRWKEHLSGRRNWQYLLWDVLVFQTWLQEHRTR